MAGGAKALDGFDMLPIARVVDKRTEMHLVMQRQMLQ
jgi:hypothetical protein